MRALVTGISGFVGGHLAEHLLGQGWEVWGCSLHRGVGREWRAVGVQFVSADLTDANAARDALLAAQPDVVFHLAAQAAVAPSHQHPWQTLQANTSMQTHVLEAVRHHLPDCVVLVVGSGEEYGLASPQDMPLREDAPLRPVSPYAVSKVTQDFLGLQYHLAYGVRAVRVRPFNHIGPRQGLGFVAADFAKQLAEAEAGLRAPAIKVGNLSAERDFTDVRDVVRAYALLASQGRWGEVYNVASGRAVAVGRLLDMLLNECRCRVEVVQDQERMRPSDTPIFVGDYSRLHGATGWQPEIPLERTVADLMAYWRAQVQGEGNE